MSRLGELWNTAMGRNPAQERALDLTNAFFAGELLPRTGFSSGLAGQMASVPLFATHRLIADNFSATPLHVYRDRKGGGSEKAKPKVAPFLTPLHGTATTWKNQCIRSMLGPGNAYGYITQFTPLGFAQTIVWLDPSQMYCDENIIDPKFWYQGTLIPNERLIHIPWVVLPGRVTGLSPIDLHRLTFETGGSAQQLAHDTFQNSGVPIGHWQNTEKELDMVKADALAKRFDARIRGRKPVVSGNDWNYKSIGLTADQVQYIEAQRMTATQVASLYGVPPEEIGGDTGSSMTYNTVEMNDLKLSSRTLRPWYVRVEEALTPHVPDGYYMKFNADAIIRTDTKTRAMVLEIGVRSGVLTLDEARALEDRPPLTPEQREEFLELYVKKATPAEPDAPELEAEQPALPPGPRSTK